MVQDGTPFWYLKRDALSRERALRSKTKGAVSRGENNNVVQRHQIFESLPRIGLIIVASRTFGGGCEERETKSHSAIVTKSESGRVRVTLSESKRGSKTERRRIREALAYVYA